MKRVVSMLLIGCMTFSLLAGCGQSSGSQSNSAPAESAQADETKTEEVAPAGDTETESTPAEEASTALSDVPVSIRFATQSNNSAGGDVLRQILAQFQEDYPNVTIELEESPGNDLITKINTDVMGDNTPDMFTFWRPEAKWNVDKYIEKGALADMTEWVNEDDFFTDLFPEYAWRTCTVNGGIYCIPMKNFYVEFLVNKEIFEEYNLELPTDWDKLITACQVLDENGIVPWVVDTAAGLDDSSRHFNAVINRAVGNQKGLELLKGTESFQQEDVIRALDYFLEMVNGYGPEDASVLQYDQAISKYLNAGTGAMILGNCSQIDVNLTDEIVDKLVALDLPLTPVSVIDAPSTEQDLTSMVYIGADGFADADKKPYLQELAKRLVSRETAKRLVEEEAQIVPHLNLDVDPSAITDLRKSANKLAENCAGDKWLLSYAKAGPVDEFRLVINDAWVGKYANGEELAKALDNALYGK